MFVGKTMSLPQSGAPERYFTKVGYGPTANFRLVWNGLAGTNTAAFIKFVNYGQKSFITLAPG